MGEDYANIFSRRPFLASFTDGLTKFSMIAAHVVFESSPDSDIQRSILNRVFNISALRDLPTGINNQNYARFAEVVTTLKLIEKLKTQGLSHIIYAGDFNLEAQNPFWKFIFETLPDSRLLVKEKTSLSETRFVRGKESGGVSSNYDHFVISSQDTELCTKASVVNYLNNDISQVIRDKYLVRQEASVGPYQKDPSKEELILERSLEVERMLENFNFTVDASEKILKDTKSNDEDLKNLKQRVFESQLNDATYYKYFAQVMSDHLPIKIECRF
jgi:hypothetical protein